MADQLHELPRPSAPTRPRDHDDGDPGDGQDPARATGDEPLADAHQADDDGARVADRARGADDDASVTTDAGTDSGLPEGAPGTQGPAAQDTDGAAAEAEKTAEAEQQVPLPATEAEDTDQDDGDDAPPGGQPARDASPQRQSTPTVSDGHPDDATDAEHAFITAEFDRVVGDRRAALTITGPADVLPSRYRVTAAATVAVAAAAHGAAALWSARSGEPCPPVAVDTRHAAALVRSERLLRIAGRPAPSAWDPLSGYYQARDGRWVQLHCNLPHHRAGVLELLGARADQDSIARAVARQDAADLEAELQSMGMCATMARTPEQWRAHPAGRAVAELPLIEIDRIDDGDPRTVTPARGIRTRAPARALSAQALPSPARPAAGLRVLDMTRIIAGPVCGRALAAYGADVLRVGAAHLPDTRSLVIDTGFGKRSTFLNLRVASDARRLRELVAGADVVVQSYRPKALDRLGFGPEALAQIRPGIVCATISAYGRLGPWSGLRGFDSLVQTASGIAVAGATPIGAEPGPTVRPVPLPAQVLDHATGHLAAFGVLAALAHREDSGGSWHVRLSLAQTGHWLTAALGERDTRSTVTEPSDDEIAPYRRSMRTEFGELSYIAPAGSVGGATHTYDRPPTSLGATHQAGWAPIR